MVMASSFIPTEVFIVVNGRKIKNTATVNTRTTMEMFMKGVGRIALNMDSALTNIKNVKSYTEEVLLMECQKDKLISYIQIICATMARGRRIYRSVKELSLLT